MIANRQITMQIPQDIFIALNANENELVTNLKLNYAIELFRTDKLTIGKAAEFAGMKHYAFECLLADRNIPISNITLDDFHDEMKLFNVFLNEKG
jgi:predicted HTH domain antitoxin